MRTEDKNTAKLSVVVPVYNVEEYLAQCLDSILSNPSEEMEIICVNDGSTDGSAEILERYAEKDKRIRVITQENRGLSAARNRGTLCATGEYILFVDSDDYVLPERFLELFCWVQKSPETDLFVTDYQMVAMESGQLRKKEYFQVGEERAPMYGIENLPKMLKKRQCFWNVWRFVYRKSFLEKNNIIFREGYICEDIDYTTRVLLSKPQMVFLHCPYYCYRVGRKNSIMRHVTPKRVMDAVALLEESICAVEESSEPWKQSVVEQFQFELFLIFGQLYEVAPVERNRIKALFKEKLPLLKKGDDWFSHMAYGTISVLGIRAVSCGLFGLKSVKHRIRKHWSVAEQNGGHCHVS